MNSPSDILRRRLLILGGLLVIPVFLLIFRLYSLQIILGPHYKNTVNHQAVRTRHLPPVRGEIIDCNGQILSGNRSHWDLTLHPSIMRQPRGYLWTSTYMMNITNWLQENLMHRPPEVDIQSIRSRMRMDMTRPIVLYRDLSFQEVAKIAEMVPPFPGVELTQRIERDYPLQGVGSHILGYCGWQWRRNQAGTRTFYEKELLGNAGLERFYNSALSGETGADLVLMDPVGFVRKRLPGSHAPVSGCDLQLTLDARAQAAAEQALLNSDAKGALVCLNIHSGAILALASAPGYNLAKLDRREYQRLSLDAEGRPLFNRALQGSYMPGSIVKPLIGLAALQEGILAPSDSYLCNGHFKLGNAKIHCSHRSGHGELDLAKAIAVSCNPYFIQLGMQLKVDTLEKYYAAAGFGSKTGIDLSEGTIGRIPSRLNTRKTLKRSWLPADTAFASIGQGLVEVTPLQAACYTAALVNGGTVYRPYLVSHIIRQSDRAVLRETLPVVKSRLPVKEEYIALIQLAMEEAVNNSEGTAEILQEAPVRLAAKTGTAEVGAKGKRTKNCWIICYGPLPNPTFAIACLIEDGEAGASTAGPVVIDFLRKWLQH